MKFWTIQKQGVLEVVDKYGVYQANFERSAFLEKRPELDELYTFVLNSFNQVNHAELQGLIFGFAAIDGTNIHGIENYDQFRTIIRNGYGAVKSLWKHFLEQDSVVMELDYRNQFNPLFIDINDFQYLMPPIMTLPPYDAGSFDIISGNLRQGKCFVSPMPSGIVQVHLPYITWENITNVHRMFTFE